MSVCNGQVCVGLVVRDHLMVILRQVLGRGSVTAVDASWEELNRRYVSTQGQRLVSEQQMAVLQVSASHSPHPQLPLLIGPYSLSHLTMLVKHIDEYVIWLQALQSQRNMI